MPNGGVHTLVLVRPSLLKGTLVMTLSTRVARTAIALLMLAVAAGCGDDKNPVNPSAEPTLVGVDIIGGPEFEVGQCG